MEFPESVQQFFRREDPFGNSVQQWAAAIGITLLVLLVLRVVRGIITRRAEQLSQGFAREWATAAINVVKATRFLFLVIVALYCGSLSLDLPERVRTIAGTVAIVALLVQAALWGNLLIQFLVAQSIKRHAGTDAASVTTLTAIGFLSRLALWSIIALLVLSNLGIDVTALIAGLGIGGIAVALAAQNILGDLFASLSIVLDKPFVLGDYIVVGDFMGTVEYIGLKTTRLRSLSGEQLIFANNDLLGSRIRNYKRMSERRVLFSIGVTYQTPHNQLEQIPQLLRQAVESQPETRFDRAHFQKFGDSALLFEVVYYVLKPEYIVMMDIQQAINLSLFRQFEERGIDFAYPTQTLHLHSADADADTDASVS